MLLLRFIYFANTQRYSICVKEVPTFLSSFFRRTINYSQGFYLLFPFMAKRQFYITFQNCNILSYYESNSSSTQLKNFICKKIWDVLVSQIKNRYALLEFIVSVCLRLQYNQTKLYTKKFDGLLVNDNKIPSELIQTKLNIFNIKKRYMF